MRKRKLSARLFSSESYLSNEPSFWGDWSDSASNALTVGGGALLGAAFSEAEIVQFPLESEWWISFASIVSGIVISTKTRALGRKREERLRETNQGDVRRALDKMSDLVRALETLSTSDQSEDDCKAYFKSVAECGVNLFKEDDLRVCIYAFEAQEVDDEGSEPQVELVKLRTYAGRPDLPRPYFDTTTPEGQKFIQNAKGRTPAITNDPDADGIRTNKQPGSQWDSYMTVPVSGTEYSFGAVSVDSRRKDVFTRLHQVYGGIIALFVAVGERVSQAAVEDIRPEAGDARRELDKIRKSREQFQNADGAKGEFDEIWNTLFSKGEGDSND